MPALIAAIGAFLASGVVRVVVTRVLVALGVSMLTFTGVQAGLSAIWTNVQGNFTGLPASVLTLLTIAKLPQAFNVIISAYTSALALRGLTAAGTLKRVVWGGNGGSVMEAPL